MLAAIETAAVCHASISCATPVWAAEIREISIASSRLRSERMAAFNRNPWPQSSESAHLRRGSEPALGV
jgi:hypothetical protein